MKQHKLSLSAAILLNLNILIGSGILIGPGLISAIAGNAGFLAWPLVALMYAPLVLCMVQLGILFPEGGGFYVYAKEKLGVFAGFLSALLYIGAYTFAISMEILALHKTILAYMSDNYWISNEIIFNIVVICLLVVLNTFGIKFLSRLLGSLTIAKILPLLILIVLLPFIMHFDFPITTTEMCALPSSLSLAMFSFLGFEYCSSLAPLIENNKKNGPRATLFAFIITAALFTAFHFGLLMLMGASTLGNLGASAGSMYAQYLTVNIPYLKPILQLLIPISSILALFASGVGLLNANILLMKFLADEKLFIGSSLIQKINTHQRPWVALLIQGILVTCITTPQLFGGSAGNMEMIAQICILSIFLSFLLPFFSLLIMQSRQQKMQIPITILAIAIAFGLARYSFLGLGSTIIERCINLWPLGAFIGIGYMLFNMRKK